MVKGGESDSRMTFSQYLQYAAEDSRVAGYSKVTLFGFVAHLISSPGLLAVFLYRTAFFLNPRFGVLGVGLAKLFTRLNQVINSCEINFHAVIGPGFYLPHPYGVVIGRDSVIGAGCTMYQNSTLGLRHSSSLTQFDGYPILGSNIRVFAGAVVCGPIKIGDGAVIAANSVVGFDVPPHTVAAGVPAKLIHRT